MSTPEGETKRHVKDVLNAADVYYEMPVPGGYGKPTLDFIGWRQDGQAFAIETKAHKEGPNARQKLTMNTMRKKGAVVFLIDDQRPGKLPARFNTVEELRRWLYHNELPRVFEFEFV